MDHPVVPRPWVRQIEIIHDPLTFNGRPPGFEKGFRAVLKREVRRPPTGPRSQPVLKRYVVSQLFSVREDARAYFSIWC